MGRMALIRFVGKRLRQCYFLKLGPTDAEKPPEREFRGGDEIRVQIQPNSVSEDCVDLTFEDGQFAIEVSREFFEIVEEKLGR